MPRAQANGIEIEYETLGDPQAPPLLLIMGLGAQLIAWDEEFCRLLAAHGHHVIRYDNRDVGLSTRLDGVKAPPLFQILTAVASGQPAGVPYTLADMADDAAGLLNALHIPAAHIVGQSMGGMIAQLVAIRHPQRVLTLTSIMSTTGDRSLPPPQPQAMAALTRPMPTEREAFVAQAVEALRSISSPGFPFNEERARRRVERSYERGYYPPGFIRQFTAIAAAGSRREALSSVHVPTLVIHGTADPLVPLEGGRDTAASIPGAELLEIEGMGHDLPEQTWPRIVEAISLLTARVAPGP